MAWSAALLIDQVCNHTYDSTHTGQERTHLPIGLWRATHDGNQDGTIPPNPALEVDGCMLPRMLDWRLPTYDDVDRHLNKSNRLPTPFLSFGTWELVSSRVHMWKKRNVRNIRLHFVATNLLPNTTSVYRVRGLVQQMGLTFESYSEGEYLIHGPVPASAFLLHLSGEGEDCLVELPLTRRALMPGLKCDPMVCRFPTGFFGGTRPSATCFHWPKDNSGAVIYGVEYPSVFLVMSDSITCGKLFTIADWVRYYS